MKKAYSIGFRLSAVLFSFFLLIIVVGFFSIGRLSDFNLVASDISSLWLPKTQFLGDLNNYTSDFRAAEASRLLAATSGDGEKDMMDLDRSIAEAHRNYEKISHDQEENHLFSDFTEKWRQYRKIVDQESALIANGRTAEAADAYRTVSRAAYDAASDTLGQLTERNVAYGHLATNRVNATYRHARWLISAAMLFSGAMIAAALLYMKGSISRPLLHLAAVMDRLAINDINVDIQGTERLDEIGEMARAAGVFRANAIELLQTQRGLAREASELAEKLADERKLAESQRNFVSMISHEFRTPLTVVDAIAQRLIKTKDRVRPDHIAERAGRIRRAVFRVINLIDNLLDASRLMETDARLEFRPTLVDLKPLLHEVSQLHREIAPGAQIQENFDAASLPVRGDSKLLMQMLSNLLSNAVKYSPAGSPITLSAAIDVGHLVIEIRDQGIGIPENDIRKVFERYSRGSNVSGIVGTGIGLYIVKMVAELHHGSVALETKEGQGSRFIVNLPIAYPRDLDSGLSPVRVAMT